MEPGFYESLKNRDVILYGEPRYCHDFRYIFNDLPVRKIVSSMPALKESLLEAPEAYVVLCAREPRQSAAGLAAAGLRHGAQYTEAHEFFALLDAPYLAKKKLVVWGAGHITGLPVIEEYAGHIAFVVDNDPALKEICKKPVYRPAEADLRDCFVVVASFRYYDEIKAELEARGMRENEDFMFYRSFHLPSHMLEKTIHANPVANVHCHFPFDFCQVSGGGYVNLCCLGMTVSPGEILTNSFLDVWNSTLAKILRLSTINKTFSFCDFTPCPVIHETGDYDYDAFFDPADYDAQPFAFPKEINVSIDHTCNLKCAHCRKDILIADSREREEIERMADRLIEEVLPNVDTLVLAGNGEVFFSETYNRMWKSSPLSQKRDSIGILTNGILFSPEIWEELRARYAKIGFSVSIDAVTAETYKKVRGGSFARLQTNMELLGNLRKAGELAYLHMNFVVRRDNCHELLPFIQWAKELHADRVRVSVVENWVYPEDYFYENISIYNPDGSMKTEFAPVFDDPVFNEPMLELINLKR